MAEDVFEKLSGSPKVLILLGARQVGKTTLIQHVLSGAKAVFLNLDVEVDKQRLLASSTLSPADALTSFGQPSFLVIDEAQRSPEAARIVKGWHDAGLPVKMILSGSSSLDLLSRSAESLTGRNEKLFLPPLLFREVLAAQSWYSASFSDAQIQERFAPQVQSLLMSCMAHGHYPEAVTTADKARYLVNLASDYLWKDVLQMGLVKTPDLIKRLLLLLAHQVGAEVSVSELASSLGTTRVTVERYLELLEEAYVIFRLSSFSTNPRKEISKSRKVYFWDTGVRNALLNEFSTHPLRPDIGALWENWVVAEMAKQNLLAGKRKDLYFWRSRAGTEVDLVVKSGDSLDAYEIKWKKQRASVRAFTSQYGVPVRVIDSSQPLFHV